MSAAQETGRGQARAQRSQGVACTCRACNRMLAFVFSMPYWRTTAVTGIELVTIGADTTMPAFQQSLRWNQAFYFLECGP